MRLEKLSVHGFKSFADKTEFVFQPGMTAFVGPNGCGKSNVVDAVKWVLGEQSIKALRGNEMQDVIFSGTPTRRSTGYAEATLSFTNTRGLLPTEFETVDIGRRIYRSGESEYYINKQRCRLKDIRNLFMDTGVGMDAYSIIEQGKVDILLTSNKQDRRAIFEEAAGISKYKSQKKICLSKLDRVSANLLRLGDIIDEVEKRMRSVKYQAAKARRWKKLDEQKRELALALAMHHYDELVAEREKTAKELFELKSEAGGLHAAIERMEAELSEHETAVIEADQRISQLEAEDVRISTQLQAAEEAVRMNERRLAELDEMEEAAKAEIAKSEASLEIMRSELERAGADVAGLDDAIDSGKTEIAQYADSMRETEQALRGMRSEIEDKRSLAVELASERAKHNNELSAIAAQREQLVRQDQRLADRIAQHRTGLAECEEQKSGLTAKHTEVAARIATLTDELRQIEQDGERIAARTGELTDQINAKRSEMASAQSRGEVLRDLEDNLEGVSAGVRHLLEAASGESPQIAGICGAVADIIEVDADHAAAIEAALGSHEQLILTETFDAMVNAIDFLARSEKGKAAFLPLARAGEGGSPALAQQPGVIGLAMGLVRCEARFESALRHLLGDVVVVDNMETARQLAASGERGVRYATLDGQLFSPHGISVGGSTRGAGGVISRRSELRLLEARQSGLEADMAVLEQQREECAGQTERQKQSGNQLSARIAEANAERTEVQTELSKLDMSLRRIESELQAGESERAENQSYIETLAGREAEAREEAARIERSETELKSALAEHETSLREGETRRDELRTKATQLEVAQAQRLEKAESLRRRTGELGGLIADRERGLEAARNRVGTCTVQRREANELILKKNGEIQEHLRRRGSLGLEKAEASNQRELVRVEYESHREKRNAASRRVKEADAKLNELNVHVTEIAMRIENLENRARSEYECTLSEEKGREAKLEERDWDLVEQEIETVNQKMRSMGAVNTYAIEELEELERRAAELTHQREDLRKAEHTLREIIRKINRKSREMFRKTFDDVRENFQGLFRKLFGGGRADIVLEEDVDILDAGIEVVACPPGKEPSSITLLSGGEKTMTAIALLFAIFKSKPSPFCMLDEVDAALDESNIDRFCLLVREFLKDSQFLVVTHSRHTMAMADILYGITMQEPGVSTKVSVKFEDAEEMAAAG